MADIQVEFVANPEVRPEIRFPTVDSENLSEVEPIERAEQLSRFIYNVFPAGAPISLKSYTGETLSGHLRSVLPGGRLLIKDKDDKSCIVDLGLYDPNSLLLSENKIEKPSASNIDDNARTVGAYRKISRRSWGGTFVRLE